MADNLLLPVSLEQMVGSDDAIFVAAVYVYNAGTTDFKNVYTNATLLTAAANPIIADGDGVLPARYIGTGSYKLVIKDTVGYPTEELSDHWTTFKTIDDLPGALDTSTFASDEAIPITPVVSKTSDFPVLAAHQGMVFDSDPTGGNITATLLSAVTAGDNFRVTFKHTGTANSVIIATTGAQTIDGSATYTLENRYEGVTLVSDGANWLISETSKLVPEVVYPPGHLFGLTLSNAADTINDITVAAGSCRDSTDTVNLDISNALTKQIDASWAVGTNAGGRSSAGLADDTWHLYLIGKALGADADVMFHNTLVPGPDDDDVLPTDYLYYRRIGSIVRASAAIVQFFQDDDHFRLKASAQVSVTATQTAQTETLVNFPTDLKFLAMITLAFVPAGADHFALVSALDEDDTAPSTSTTNISAKAGQYNTNDILLRTNNIAQFRYRTDSPSGTATLRIITRGWIDRRDGG